MEAHSGLEITQINAELRGNLEFATKSHKKHKNLEAFAGFLRDGIEIVRRSDLTISEVR